MQPNLGDWRRVQFPSLNGPPSLTERTSSGLVRLHEAPRFQRVSQVARQWIQRALFRLASPSGERSVGISGGNQVQFLGILRCRQPSVSRVSERCQMCGELVERMDTIADGAEADGLLPLGAAGMKLAGRQSCSAVGLPA